MKIANGISMKILTAVLVSCILMNIIQPSLALAAPFSDIQNHWAEKEIFKAAASNVINGYDGKFWPTSNVTRAQFAVMIVNALGLEEEAAALKNIPTGYSDLPSSYYAAGHVMVASEKGLISGYPDGTFRPQAQIRRDEITSILIRALSRSGSSTDGAILNKFTDAEDIPGWAKGAVSMAVGMGFLSGFPDGTFRPSKPASRGETAVLVNKLLMELNRGFTFSGKIVNVYSDLNELVLNISGQEERFRLSSETVLYDEAKKITLDDLRNGDAVSIIIDSLGKLKYVERLDRLEENGGLVGTAVTYSERKISTASGETNVGNLNEPVNLLVLTKEGQAAQVRREVQKLGGAVDSYFPDLNYLTVSLPEGSIGRMVRMQGIDSLNIDTINSLNFDSKEEILSLTNSRGMDATDTTTSTGKDPQKSLAATKNSISADQFAKEKGVKGEGQIIAIIDTGVDPGHPDLQTTTDGKRKIISWKDFTEEGAVDTKAFAQIINGKLRLVDGNYQAETIVSKSNIYHYGYIRELDFSPEDNDGMDINFNGVTTDVFAVLVVDDREGAKYETVYVDTDMDKDFTDETGLKLFDTNPVFAGFVSKDNQNKFNFNVAEIDSTGNTIKIGFDGNDHGTHVAGIVAANGFAQGVAPGAQIMALKALDSRGRGDDNWSSVIEAMVYAASHGAKVINLSLGYQPPDLTGGSVPAKLINTLTKRYGVLFVVAAGNGGPGFNSLATPADADLALSVGAFISPEMWKVDFGWDVPDTNLRLFSSVGPRGDGSMAPRIVAPGSAVSTVPMRDGEIYFYGEGTSMAAPHVSGSLALLMEAAQKNNLAVDPSIIKRAVELGSRKVPGYSYAEQGYGMIDLIQAWNQMQLLKDNPEYTSTVFNSSGQTGVGVLEKWYIPGRLSWYLGNETEEIKRLTIYSDSDWVKEAEGSILIPPGQMREVPLEFNMHDKPGLYSELVRADDWRTYGSDIDLLATVVKPYVLNKANDYTITLDDTLKPAQYRRYFYKVAPGTNRLDVKLAAEKSGVSFRGKVRMYLYSPDGEKKAETLFAGGDSSGQESVAASVDNPEAGTWEVIVYNSASLSELGLTDSRYNLTTSASDIAVNNLPVQNRDVIVSIVPEKLAGDRDSYVTIQIRNRGDKKPFQGLIEINGRLYYTRKGYITLPVKAQSGEQNFQVRTLTDINKYQPLEYNFNVR